MTQKEIAEDIQTAVETLRRGGLILYPTDTIWGIGCDATNEDAACLRTEATERLQGTHLSGGQCEPASPIYKKYA